MTTTRIDVRQAIYRPTPVTVGNTANTQLDTILSKIDTELGSLLRSQNVHLTDGGNITFSGTQVLFTQNLNLVLFQGIGTSNVSPITISLGSATQSLNNGDMLIATVNYTANTAVVSVVSSATGLGPVNTTNQNNIFVIATRIVLADSTNVCYFANGSMFTAGQTAKLGAGGSSSGGGISAWVSGHSYSIGDVIYFTDNKIYRCITANSDATFTSSKWQCLTLSAQSELTDNYVKNSRAKIDVSGWNVYKNTAQATPVSGTGGSPSVTIARNTTNPLRNGADFIFSKPASNCQGEGVSTDITIDIADQSKPLRVKIDYKASANFSFANSDMTFWMYDITNAIVIPLTPANLDGSGALVAEFQSNANSTSYRIIAHVATTNANAYTLQFTNVDISRTNLVYANLQDKQYNLTVTGDNSWSTNKAVGIPYKTKDGTWRLIFNIEGNFSSTTSLTITLTGVSFATTSGVGQAAACMDAGYNTGGTACCNSGSSSITFRMQTASTTGSTSGDVELNSMPTWAVDFYPVQLGDGAETRVVSFESSRTVSPSGISGAAWNIIKYAVDAGFDSVAAYNPTTGLYTVAVSGDYNINTKVYFGGTPAVGNGCGLDLRLNGTSVAYTDFIVVDVSGAQALFHSILLKNLKVGDTIGAYNYCQWGGGLGIANRTNLSIFRLSGPATIAASEKVACLANLITANQTITTGGYIEILFNSVNRDTHARFDTTTGRYTAPSSGYYLCSYLLGYLMGGTATSGVYATFRINSSSFYGMYYNNQGFTAGKQISISGTSVLYLNAGDYVSVWAYTETQNISVYASSNYFSQFSIIKV